MKIDNWELVYMSNGQAIEEGAKITSHRGDDYTLTGGRPPHKINSTGRVYVKANDHQNTHQQEFFPSVFDLVWRQS